MNKKFKNYLILYLSFLFFICIFVLYTKHNVGNDSTISEWIINYSGGFTKRGIIGQLSVYIAYALDLNLRDAILIFQITGSDKTAIDNLDRVTMPIVGQYLTDKTTANAMYKLLEENSDADFIFYPQVEKRNTCPILGICLLYRHTEVEVKSRLGTFK